MDTKNLNKYNYIGIAVVIIGLTLCIALIQEFFGTAGAFVESLCSTTGDGDSCSKVAQSIWSGFRGLPVLGDVAVAHLGFTFYGFCGYLFFSILRGEEGREGEGEGRGVAKEILEAGSDHAFRKYGLLSAGRTKVEIDKTNARSAFAVPKSGKHDHQE